MMMILMMIFNSLNNVLFSGNASASEFYESSSNDDDSGEEDDDCDPGEASATRYSSQKSQSDSATASESGPSNSNINTSRYPSVSTGSGSVVSPPPATCNPSQKSRSGSATSSGSGTSNVNLRYPSVSSGSAVRSGSLDEREEGIEEEDEEEEVEEDEEERVSLLGEASRSANLASQAPLGMATPAVKPSLPPPQSQSVERQSSGSDFGVDDILNAASAKPPTSNINNSFINQLPSTGPSTAFVQASQQQSINCAHLNSSDSDLDVEDILVAANQGSCGPPKVNTSIGAQSPLFVTAAPISSTLLPQSSDSAHRLSVDSDFGVGDILSAAGGHELLPVGSSGIGSSSQTVRTTDLQSGDANVAPFHSRMNDTALIDSDEGDGVDIILLAAMGGRPTNSASNNSSAARPANLLVPKPSVSSSTGASKNFSSDLNRPFARKDELAMGKDDLEEDGVDDILNAAEGVGKSLPSDSLGVTGGNGVHKHVVRGAEQAQAGMSNPSHHGTVSTQAASTTAMNNSALTPVKEATALPKQHTNVLSDSIENILQASASSKLNKSDLLSRPPPQPRILSRLDTESTVCYTSGFESGNESAKDTDSSESGVRDRSDIGRSKQSPREPTLHNVRMNKSGSNTSSKAHTISPRTRSKNDKRYPTLVCHSSDSQESDDSQESFYDSTTHTQERTTLLNGVSTVQQVRKKDKLLSSISKPSQKPTKNYYKVTISEDTV
jgi:hypothetical protein